MKRFFIILASVLAITSIANAQSEDLTNRIQSDNEQELYNIARELYMGTQGKEKIKELAIKIWTILANEGYPPAQYTMGECFFRGDVVDKDYSKATEYFKLGAENNDPNAQYMLALCLYSGTGVDKNLAKAADYFSKASENGHLDAPYYLANCYYNGEGVPQNYKTAVEWYKIAAEKGFITQIEALKQLAKCYENGEGVKKDLNKARLLMKEVEELENPKVKMGEFNYKQ